MVITEAKQAKGHALEKIAKHICQELGNETIFLLKNNKHLYQQLVEEIVHLQQKKNFKSSSSEELIAIQNKVLVQKLSLEQERLDLYNQDPLPHERISLMSKKINALEKEIAELEVKLICNRDEKTTINYQTFQALKSDFLQNHQQLKKENTFELNQKINNIKMPEIHENEGLVLATKTYIMSLYEKQINLLRANASMADDLATELEKGQINVKKHYQHFKVVKSAQNYLTKMDEVLRGFWQNDYFFDNDQKIIHDVSKTLIQDQKVMEMGYSVLKKAFKKELTINEFLGFLQTEENTRNKIYEYIQRKNEHPVNNSPYQWRLMTTLVFEQLAEEMRKNQLYPQAQKQLTR